MLLSSTAGCTPEPMTRYIDGELGDMTIRPQPPAPPVGSMSSTSNWSLDVTFPPISSASGLTPLTGDNGRPLVVTDPPWKRWTDASRRRPVIAAGLGFAVPGVFAIIGSVA